MAKLVKYTVAGDSVAKDRAWRREFVEGKDKEYHVVSSRNSAMGLIRHLSIVVSDETALQMKIRNPNIKVLPYGTPRSDR